MNLRAGLVVLLAIAFVGSSVLAEATPPSERYLLLLKRHSEDQDGDRGRGSSDDNDGIVVRYLGSSDGGQDLEYDLPDEATSRDREAAWQFPAKIRVSSDGSMILLNMADLERRRDRFLKKAGWSKQICGRWIFTWNAFKIECDPLSAFGIVEAFQAQPKLLADGAPFAMKGAVGAALMRCAPATGGGQKCTVALLLDADATRRELAEADVVIGDLTGKPISVAAAAKKRAETQIRGTVEVTFEADAAGVVERRTIVIHSEQLGPVGEKRTTFSTAILTRTKLKS